MCASGLCCVSGLHESGVPYQGANNFPLICMVKMHSILTLTLSPALHNSNIDILMVNNIWHKLNGSFTALTKSKQDNIDHILSARCCYPTGSSYMYCPLHISVNFVTHRWLHKYTATKEWISGPEWLHMTSPFHEFEGKCFFYAINIISLIFILLSSSLKLWLWESYQNTNNNKK